MHDARLTMQEKCFLRSYLKNLPDGGFRAKKIYEVFAKAGEECRAQHALVFVIFFQTEFQGHGRYLAVVQAQSASRGYEVEKLRASGDPFELPRIALDCEEDFIGEHYVVLRDEKGQYRKASDEKVIERLNHMCSHHIHMAAKAVGAEAPEETSAVSAPKELEAYIKGMEAVQPGDGRQIAQMCRELGALWALAPVELMDFPESFDELLFAKEYGNWMDVINDWEFMEYARIYFKERALTQEPADAGTARRFRLMWKAIARIWKKRKKDKFLGALLTYGCGYIQDTYPDVPQEELNRHFPKYLEDYCKNDEA